MQQGRKIVIMEATLTEKDERYGQPAECYVCDRPHKAFGFVMIEINDMPTDGFPLCEPCRTRDDFDVAVMQKYVHDRTLSL